MNKKMIISGLLIASIAGNACAWSERDERIEQLAGQTGFRKGLKYWIDYSGWAIIPAAIAGAALSKNDKAVLAGAVSAFLVSACFHGFIRALRAGHKHIVRRSFRSLYNKRVDGRGNVVSDFHSGAERLPFALDDRQFILFGFASGFTVDELIHLANKCGRTEVARQINHGQHFAHTTA
jgi:hypothetical protein